MANRRDRGTWGLGLALGIAISALGLVALRLDTIDLRYRRGEALETAAALRERRARLLVERAHLRDPMRLIGAARELGFVPPERILELPVPARANGGQP